MWLIEPGLWLGCARDTYDGENLKIAGITHVVTALEVPHFTLAMAARRVHQLQIQVPDAMDAPLHTTFPLVCRWIHAARHARPLPSVGAPTDDGGSATTRASTPTTTTTSEAASAGERGVVLIHCFAGISRSVTLLAAYLMWAYFLTPVDALARIREVRAAATPNDGFWEKLHAWYTVLSSARVPSPLPGLRVLSHTPPGAQPVLSWNEWERGVAASLTIDDATCDDDAVATATVVPPHASSPTPTGGGGVPTTATVVTPPVTPCHVHVMRGPAADTTLLWV